MVSDERAKEIIAVGTAATNVLRSCFKELLADREERIEREQAVIAKIKEYINALNSHCCQGALFAILDHIRNPKEAILTPQPNPEARNSPGHTHA